MMWCKKCRGKVVIDRTHVGAGFELNCLMCGKRFFTDNAPALNRWIYVREVAWAYGSTFW